MIRHSATVGAAIVLALAAATSVACTTAVVSGRVTDDGRPLLWKNRDTRSTLHNEVAVISGERFLAVAVVNAGARESIWMGANEAGFCIENSLSRDLRVEHDADGPRNGQFMRIALGRCATVDEFRELLKETNASGRKTVANFGVIDASGGASIFETGPESFYEYNANDPEQAPDGVVVRSNFAMTARGLPAEPTAASLNGVCSKGRYLRAGTILDDCRGDGVSLLEMLTRCARDLSDPTGVPYAGTVNGASGPLPDSIPTARTISRTTTVSAAVFHGVRPGEDPRLTTMWTILGDPKFSIAAPVFPVGTIAEELTGDRGGQIGEIALTLRDWSLGFDRDSVDPDRLPAIWGDLWRHERTFVDETLARKERWGAAERVPIDEITEWHALVARKAMAAMEAELGECKHEVLSQPMPTVPPTMDHVVRRSTEIRVALYDHTEPITGSENVLRTLPSESGFHTQPVSPDQIRDGDLRQFDVLIMPGGSGSKQAARLEEKGRQAIRDFVRSGGGYVGICAGSYLASAQYDWSLGLINARVWDRAHWARGTGNVRLDVSAAGAELFGVRPGELGIYYGQGPLLVPDDEPNEPNMPGYRVFATYASEVAKKGAPQNVMIGAHAIIGSEYGIGRVLCFSPHPEKPGGPGSLLVDGVRWASAGRTSATAAAHRK